MVLAILAAAAISGAMGALGNVSLAYPKWWRRSPWRFLPYLGHVRPDVMLLRDGSLLAMGHLRGVPHELATNAERNAAMWRLNHLWASIADDNIAAWTHLVRDAVTEPPPLPAPTSPYVEDFWKNYDETVLGGLFRNDWYLSLLISPQVHAGGRALGAEFIRVITNARYKAERIATVTAVNDLWQTAERRLDGYRVTRLGEREGRRGVFSEMSEALRRFMYVDHQPIGRARPGASFSEILYDPRITFKPDHYTYDAADGRRYGSIVSLKKYMEEPTPGMFDDVLSMPCRLVFSQSISFVSKSDAIQASTRKGRKMVEAGDPAVADMREVHEANRQIGRGRAAKGTHQLSIAVLGKTRQELMRNQGLARRVIGDASAHPRTESLGNKAAFWGMLPGNLQYRPGPEPISTVDFAKFVSFGGFPSGSDPVKWDGALLPCRTTGDTLYNLQPHSGVSEDNAMTAFYGQIGTGKSTAALLYVMSLLQALGPHGFCFGIDKDHSSASACRESGGVHSAVRLGEWTGAAPLKALSNTPGDRQFITRLLRAAIMLDGRGPMPSADDIRLPRAVYLTMRLPVAMRSIEMVRAFLGHIDPQGAGARLERWCRRTSNGTPGEYGWVFDGEEDDLDLSRRWVERDLTEVLNNPDVVAPLVQYWMYRIRKRVDGRPIIFKIEEASKSLALDFLADETEDFIRTGRKNNIMVIIITQQVEDFLHSKIGIAITEQIANKFFFQNDDAKQATYCGGVVNCTAGEFNAIKRRLLPYQALLKRDSAKEDGGDHPSAQKSVILDFNMKGRALAAAAVAHLTRRPWERDEYQLAAE